MRSLGGITDSMDMSFSKLLKSVMDREAGMLQSMGSERVGHDRATELNSGLIYPHSSFFIIYGEIFIKIIVIKRNPFCLEQLLVVLNKRDFLLLYIN